LSRSPAPWYEQIVAASRSANELVARGRPAFDQDELLQRAARNICLEVGEAAKQIAAQDGAELDRTDYSRWPLVIRMRDFYGHNYPGTDPSVLWDTMAADLPAIGAAGAHRLEQLGY